MAEHYLLRIMFVICKLIGKWTSLKRCT